MSRNGVSMNRVVNTARPSASNDQPSRPNVPMFQSSTAPSPTRGQCQRYQEYDGRPNQRSRPFDSTRVTRLVGAHGAATRRAAVPSAGTVAAMPGYGVTSL